MGDENTSVLDSVKDSNQTTVASGVLAGAVVSILWWVVGESLHISAPEPVVAASVVVATAIIQYFAGGKTSWL